MAQYKNVHACMGLQGQARTPTNFPFVFFFRLIIRTTHRSSYVLRNKTNNVLSIVANYTSSTGSMVEKLRFENWDFKNPFSNHFHLKTHNNSKYCNILVFNLKTSLNRSRNKKLNWIKNIFWASIFFSSRKTQ